MVTSPFPPPETIQSQRLLEHAMTRFAIEAGANFPAATCVTLDDADVASVWRGVPMLTINRHGVRKWKKSQEAERILQIDNANTSVASLKNVSGCHVAYCPGKAPIDRINQELRQLASVAADAESEVVDGKS